FGNPMDRDPARVLDDVRRGLVSSEVARRQYGVAIADGAVDTSETSRLRAATRRAADDRSKGPERTAWDVVFRPAELDRLAASLARFPLQQRKALRATIYREVLAKLPPDFPAGSADERVIGEAQHEFETAVAAIGPAE